MVSSFLLFRAHSMVIFFVLLEVRHSHAELIKSWLMVVYASFLVVTNPKVLD